MTAFENVPQQFVRNMGWLSMDEQEKLRNSSVAIAGAGGDGGALAVQLARFGVGELRLADPDPFEVENLNRQACCTAATIGVNKAVAVGDYLRGINPDLKIVTYTDGVTEDNVNEFISGADLVIDETEFTMHALGVMIAREARKKDIPNLMTLNIGFGALTTTYHPRKTTLEKVLGLSEDAPLDEIAGESVSITKWLATLPSYADLDTFIKVAGESKDKSEQLDVPTVVQGVALAAGVAATQAALSLWEGKNNRPNPVYARNVIAMDAMDLTTKIIRRPDVSIKYAMLRMALKSKLGRTPKTV
jgi:tRNA threonylcarbamoyladenosine dehydratase